MKTHKIFQLITAILESILAVPFLGAVIILGLGWSPLFLMLILHIVTLLFCNEVNAEKKGSILGILASVLGWIPIVGLLLHIVTTFFLWKAFLKEDRR